MLERSMEYEKGCTKNKCLVQQWTSGNYNNEQGSVSTRTEKWGRDETTGNYLTNWPLSVIQQSTGRTGN
jgi:hypothetical protein